MSTKIIQSINTPCFGKIGFLIQTELCTKPYTPAEVFSFGKITFYPRLGGLKEVYQIVKTGEEFNKAKIIERVSNFEAITLK